MGSPSENNAVPQLWITMRTRRGKGKTTTYAKIRETLRTPSLDVTSMAVRRLREAAALDVAALNGYVNRGTSSHRHIDTKLHVRASNETWTYLHLEKLYSIQADSHLAVMD
jgi:signal recognition particle GTPase